MKHKAATSAYIHIPFCRSKCDYCDFNSYAGSEHLIGSYLQALIKEIDVVSARRAADEGIIPVQLKTIFFGGGTPTYVPSSFIAAVCEKLGDTFGIDLACETTIECNPGTVDIAKIKDYKTCGINRVSIGLQSASDNLLALAGRTHTAADFTRTVQLLHQEGFGNISADLIEGLPGQQTADLMDSLVFAVGSGLSHISLYSLSIEPGTPFYDRYHIHDELLPDAAAERTMYHLAIDFLKEKGYEQYEISNFAKPGYQSRHNVSCWKGDEYFGFGAGAHSYVDGNRYSNVSGIESYIRRMGLSDADPRPGPQIGSPAMDTVTMLSPDDMRNEYFMLGFRLLDGISEAEYTARFGQGFDRYGPRLATLEEQGLIASEGGRYRLTAYGLDYANKVFIEFV